MFATVDTEVEEALGQKQHLLLRGSSDFESVETYETWVQSVARQANGQRQVRIAEELAVMRPLVVERLKEHSEEDVLVTSWSTIRVKHNAYSVPSRLIGQMVRVHVYDDRLDVRHGEKSQLVVDRLHGRNGHHINYRHIIWSLVQKPWAFAQYRYREELFPSVVFRKAYDAFLAKNTDRGAEIEYLRVLHLAASTMESEVEAVLERLLAAGTLISSADVKAAVAPTRSAVPVLEEPKVDLHEYDALLGREAS